MTNFKQPTLFNYKMVFSTKQKKHKLTKFNLAFLEL